MNDTVPLPKGVTLGTVQAGDLAELLALWAVAAENEGRIADTAQSLAGLLARDPDSLIVARRDGRIVGTLIAGWDGWRAHLYRLAVHPDLRRQGIASALLAAAAERLSALGARRLDAMVLEGNELGQALWRDHGYAPQQHWRRWVRPATA